MDSVSVQIPQIAVTPAPYEKPVEEPASPFSWATVTLDDDSFRQHHLTPPPVASPRIRQLSPLRPDDAPVTGKGLERERFEALLKTSRERNLAVGARKAGDLRKEIALKAHKHKQLERRMLFLSKVQAPPSPGATLLPKTPPESPAVFHYTLPSPGLESPLALFESLASENPARISSQPRESWIEQVVFRIPGDESKPKTPTIKLNHVPSRRNTPSKRLPSLDQITARLSFQGQVVTPPTQVLRPASTRLPAFLKAERTPPKEEAPLPKATPAPAAGRPALTSVGRLQLPNKSIPISAPTPISAETSAIIPPPQSPATPNLEVTVTVIPRTASSSPSQLSEQNLVAFDSRSNRSKDMLSMIKRRMLPSAHGVNGREQEERRMKRKSAPAELQARMRCGFQHPVLTLPGGF